MVGNHVDAGPFAHCWLWLCAAACLIARSFGVVIGLLVFGWVWSPWAALSRVPWTSMVLLAGGGFLASFIGQMAFYQALRMGRVSQITPVAGTYPLVAALLGWCGASPELWDRAGEKLAADPALAAAAKTAVAKAIAKAIKK